MKNICMIVIGFLFVNMINSSCSILRCTSSDRQDLNYSTMSLTFPNNLVADPNIDSLLQGFISRLVVFSVGVNSYSPNPTDYYASARSYCSNDSSFVIFTAKSGAFAFYGNSDKIAPEYLEQYVFLNGYDLQVLMDVSFSVNACNSKATPIRLAESNGQDFVLNSYRDLEGRWSLVLNPNFYEKYYFHNDRFVLVDRVFSD